jgi:tetratricopeptide (TPR) repeat protein
MFYENEKPFHLKKSLFPNSDTEPGPETKTSSHQLGPHSQPAKLLLSLGKKLYSSSQYNEALSFFKACELKLPNDPEVQLWLGMSFFLCSNESEAAKSFDEAIRLSHNPNLMLKKVGDFYFEQQQLDSCKSYYIRYLMHSQNSPKTILELGRKLMSVEEFDAALKFFITLAECRLFDVSYEMTWCNLMLKQTDAAFCAFASMAPDHPRYTICCAIVAHFRYKLGFYEISYSLYLELLKAGFVQDQCYIGIISSLYKLQRYEKAIYYCKVAMEFFPKKPSFHYFLSDLYVFQNNIQQSLNVLRKVALIFRDNSLAVNKLWRYYYKTGDHSSALKYLLLAHKNDCSSAKVMASIALSYHHINDIDNCEQWRRKLDSAFITEKHRLENSDKCALTDNDVNCLVQKIRSLEKSLNKLNKILNESSYLPTDQSFHITQLPKPSTTGTHFDGFLNTRTSLIFDVRKNPDSSIEKQIALKNLGLNDGLSRTKPCEYSLNIEYFIQFLIKNEHHLVAKSSQKVSRATYKFVHLILECAHFVDYTRHAINCDVICHEMTTLEAKPQQTIAVIKSLVKPNLVRSMLSSLSKLSAYEVNLNLMIKALSLQLKQTKLKILETLQLPSRLEKYFRNLKDYINLNLKCTALKKSTSKRFHFFSNLSIMCQTKFDCKTNESDVALIHCLVLCMVLATKDPINLDYNAQQTVSSLITEIKKATSFEVRLLGTTTFWRASQFT